MEEDSTSHESESQGKETLSDKEILESESAQNILPYLTLDRLSDHEKAEILRLADRNLLDLRNGELPNNKFATINLAESAIAGAVGEIEAWNNREIPPKLGEARKLFCASLLDATNNSDNADAKWEIYNGFFGVSPDFSSYCGGLKSSLELLTISERVNQNPCSREIYDEIIYDYSFANFNGFDKILEGAKPVEQLRLLPIYDGIARRCDPDSYSRGALSHVLDALSHLSQDSTSTLVGISAYAIGKNIVDDFNAEWVDIDITDSEYADLVARDTERREQLRLQQESLHRDFPTLPHDYRIERIAPGVAGAFNASGKMDIIADKDEVKGSLLNYKGDNSLGLDRDMAYLLGTAHDSRIKEIVDENLGLDLADISLEAQVQLLKFMTEADDKRFDSLCSTLHNVAPETRLKLTEGFLATGFGEDFGDALLDIANSERISGEQLEEILNQIGSCRESIRGITGFYRDFDDGKFAEQYAKAANERLTDAVMAFREIADTGVAKAVLQTYRDRETNEITGQLKASFGYEDAMEALGYEAKSLEIIHGTLQDVADGKDGAFAERFLDPDETHRRSFYNLYSPDHGYVLLYTRSEGSNTFDPEYECGKFRNRYKKNSNGGVEASISFSVNPVDPFSLPNPQKPNRKAMQNPRYYDPATMDKVSAIRLDREGRKVGMAHDDKDREPVEMQGVVSVDLAAINDREDTPSGKIARLFSVGNTLRLRRAEAESEIRDEVATGGREQSGDDGSLNHNTNYFSQEKYGTSDGFSELVGYIDRNMGGLCALYPPKPGEGITGQMQRANRARGRKALRRVA